MLRVIVLALGLLAAVTTAQNMCECGAYIMTSDGSYDNLYMLIPLDMESCDMTEACRDWCVVEGLALSCGTGDLNCISSDGERTIGQFLCDGYGSPVNCSYVDGGYKLCDMAWEYAGTSSLQPLSCDANGLYEDICSGTK